jgi:uncharacterized protein (DUF58 family)
VNLLKDIFPANRLYWLLISLTVVFILGFIHPFLISVAQICLILLVTVFAADILLLFSLRRGVTGERRLADRFSNGDANPVHLVLTNFYPFDVNCQIYDELPFQFQKRDFILKTDIVRSGQRELRYTLRPVNRGVYSFGALNAYIASPLKLIRRRYKFAVGKSVAVYPAFIQMHRYELLTVYDRLREAGVKKVRRVGHTFEFDQIRDYVVGDDYRAINWRATARRASLMVNQYQDEITNYVYNIIDGSRNMQKAFKGMTLLDYAINTSLVLSNTAVLKKDCAGLITFADTMQTFIPADKRRKQMHKILEALYGQETAFLEADYQAAYAYIKGKLTRRCLLILYTNFESLSALKRQLVYLKELARVHLLLVVFFEDEEIKELTEQPAKSIEEIYTKIMSEEFLFEKRQMVRELQQLGVNAILTPPEMLTVNTLNKYLEFKSRGYV